MTITETSSEPSVNEAGVRQSAPERAPIQRVSIIVSKGSLEGIYPALIMANGARAEGIEANLFFTFFGLDAIHRKRIEHIKVATVGNPAMHIPTLLGGLPGMSALATHIATTRIHRKREAVMHGAMTSAPKIAAMRCA